MPSVQTIQTLKSFTLFFQENQEQFISFAYSYLRNREEAEDIVMESLASLWENRDKWQADSNIKGLLLTIIKNKALNHLAHLQVRMRVETEINDFKQKELDLRITSLQACDPHKIFDSEIQRIVNRVLLDLPTQSRNVFLLSRYKNTPNKKIAQQLGISVKSVEFHITKTLKILRVELKDYLISFFF